MLLSISVLLVIVLAYAVVILCDKATLQQTLQFYMRVTNCVAKVFAHILQQNQALQLKS